MFETPLENNNNKSYIENYRNIIKRFSSGTSFRSNIENYSDDEINILVAELNIPSEDIEFLIKTRQQRQELTTAGVGTSLLTDREKMRESDIESRLRTLFDRKENELYKQAMRQEALDGKGTEFHLYGMKSNDVLILTTESGNEYRIIPTGGKIFIMDKRSNVGKKSDEYVGTYLSGSADSIIEKGKPFRFGKDGVTTPIASIQLVEQASI